MTRISSCMYFFGLVLLFSFSTQGLSATTNDPVDSAIIALKNGDYQAALRLLKSPISNVSAHPDRQNALGLSYYYLQQYTKAKIHFKLAQKTPRRHEAAFYLGNIAQKRGNKERANYWYSMAANQYEDREVQTQAESALLRLTINKLKTINSNNASRHYLYVALDSNQIGGIIDPDDSSGSDTSDTSTISLIAGKITLSPIGSSTAWTLGAHYYAEKYAEITSNDLVDLKYFTTIEFVEKNQSLVVKLAQSNQTLDDHDYLEKIEIGFKNTWHDKQQFIVSGRLIDVSSPDGRYIQYEGITTELGAKFKGNDNDVKWQLGLKWRDEDRQGLNTVLSNDAGDEFNGFTAYARESLTLTAKTSWAWNNQWQQKLEANVRSTQYQDNDLYLANDSDGGLSSQTREAFRTVFKAELIHHLTQKLDLNLRYENTDEDSNDNGYDYASQRFSVGMSYIF